jgi:hypothetical protein
VASQRFAVRDRQKSFRQIRTLICRDEARLALEQRAKVMAKLSDEERLDQILEQEYQGGVLPLASRLYIIEQFRAARAQRRAAIYALWAAIGTAACAVFCGGCCCDQSFRSWFKLRHQRAQLTFFRQWI